MLMFMIFSIERVELTVYYSVCSIFKSPELGSISASCYSLKRMSYKSKLRSLLLSYLSSSFSALIIASFSRSMVYSADCSPNRSLNNWLCYLSTGRATTLIWRYLSAFSLSFGWKFNLILDTTSSSDEVFLTSTRTLLINSN